MIAPRNEAGGFFLKREQNVKLGRGRPPWTGEKGRSWLQAGDGAEGEGQPGSRGAGEEGEWERVRDRDRKVKRFSDSGR
jgi:hypothetical protein